RASKPRNTKGRACQALLSAPTPAVPTALRRLPGLPQDARPSTRAAPSGETLEVCGGTRAVQGTEHVWGAREDMRASILQFGAAPRCEGLRACPGRWMTCTDVIIPRRTILPGPLSSITGSIVDQLAHARRLASPSHRGDPPATVGVPPDMKRGRNAALSPAWTTREQRCTCCGRFYWSAPQLCCSWPASVTSRRSHRR